MWSVLSFIAAVSAFGIQDTGLAKLGRVLIICLLALLGAVALSTVVYFWNIWYVKDPYWDDPDVEDDKKNRTSPISRLWMRWRVWWSAAKTKLSVDNLRRIWTERVYAKWAHVKEFVSKCYDQSKGTLQLRLWQPQATQEVIPLTVLATPADSQPQTVGDHACVPKIVVTASEDDDVDDDAPPACHTSVRERDPGCTLEEGILPQPTEEIDIVDAYSADISVVDESLPCSVQLA